MTKNNTIFRCSKCGFETVKWAGKCSSCGEWNTFEETVSTPKTNMASPVERGLSSGCKTIRLNTVSTDNYGRIVTNNKEFNRIMGGGFVRDSVTLLGGRPGGGKSTLALMIGNDLAHKGLVVLYITGEESESQVKSRANRVCETISDNLMIVSETSMDKSCGYIDEINPSFIITDSIQTFYLEGVSGSHPGTPTQINECTYKHIKIAKNKQNPRAILLLSQMTKEDEFKGDNTLQHAVDTVLFLDSEMGDKLICMTQRKNRYADSSETCFFTLQDKGMIPVENPSEYFITTRDFPVPGSALVVAKEGSRNFVVEIESLVSKSYFPFPSRKGTGINKEILEIMIEILEQRGGLNFYDKNITVMVTGGLRIKEPAINLGIIMSIASCSFEKALPENSIFIGEVGLTGEIKSVPAIESRVREVDRLGYKTVYIPKNSLGKEFDKSNLKIKIVETSTIREILGLIYPQGNKKVG